MDSNEKKLSDYIDKLNAEKKPGEHENSVDSQELEKLFDTVRQVRALREPALPDADFPEKVARAVAEHLTHENHAKKPKRAWYIGVAAVAAAVVFMIAVINFVLPFGRTNIVYAMQQAFQGVKVYHGILEFIESNAEGKQTTQAKLEVWADKEGHYYVKELEGSQKGLVTVNNGQKKWQIRPDSREVYLFPAFPDPYKFTFELGNEVEKVKDALETKVTGEDTISGRKAVILEVSPRGGVPYRIWIDKETRLPLQKQSGMQNALQYRATYTEIDFTDSIPAELTAYSLPDSFKEIDTNPEQVVNSMEEASKIAGFTPKSPEGIPEGYNRDSIAIETVTKFVKFYYTTQDKQNRVVVLQGRAAGELKPAATAILGKVGNSIAEIQSPVEANSGILGGGGAYAVVTNISSIRWQEAEFEYAVIGNVSLNELSAFIRSLSNDRVYIPSTDEQSAEKPQVEVPVDLEVEKNEQKSVDAGHSPWKLDPVFVAQVFASLKVSPEGIQGEYPIKTEELKVIQNTGSTVIIDVSGNKTLVKRIYLKRLIRQDSTGIWTVVGYDPVDRN